MPPPALGATAPGAAAGPKVALDPSTAKYVRNLLPRNVVKYWLQRYSLFSKYDEGIQVSSVLLAGPGIPAVRPCCSSCCH
jgi:hypothetical protein